MAAVQVLHAGFVESLEAMMASSRGRLRMNSGSILASFLVRRFEQQTVKEDPNCSSLGVASQALPKC
jgi:hypothetical protein